MQLREKTVTLLDMDLPVALGSQTSAKGMKCSGFAWENPTLPLDHPRSQQVKEQEA